VTEVKGAAVGAGWDAVGRWRGGSRRARQARLSEWRQPQAPAPLAPVATTNYHELRREFVPNLAGPGDDPSPQRRQISVAT